MFTGLVEALGAIAATEEMPHGRILTVTLPFAAELAVGESVAVNGCCLTAVSVAAQSAVFQAGPETLARTNLGALRVGDAVNLERALRADARLGGHFVQGHIDAVGAVRRRRREGDWEHLTFSCGPLAAELVPKGSIAVDGVSLTVVEVRADSFSAMLIPHTLAATTLGLRQPGDAVNLETDILGKYVRRFLPPVGSA
jgi:riboflavin synthase